MTQINDWQAFETLTLTISEQIATIRLNRPKVLNALNSQVFDELERVFMDLTEQDEVRVVLLTGTGEKAFAAGADITELASAGVVSGEMKARRGQVIFRMIESCGKPVIALINGFALGGGCELALACTLRIASESAKLGQPEVKLGLIPGYGGTQRLPRLIGQSMALKMLMTGEIIGAAEALRIGLVDEIVPLDRLHARGEELARAMLAVAPLAMTACMEAVRRGSHVQLDDALDIEAEIFGRLCGTEDKSEGTAAFLEKRSPLWTGR